MNPRAQSFQMTELLDLRFSNDSFENLYKIVNKMLRAIKKDLKKDIDFSQQSNTLFFYSTHFLLFHVRFLLRSEETPHIMSRGLL